MPVPRLFEAASDTVEQWAHVVGSLLAIGGPRTASALLAEIVGEDLPGSDQPYVRERRQLGDGPEVDLLVRDRDRRWAVSTDDVRRPRACHRGRCRARRRGRRGGRNRQRPSRGPCGSLARGAGRLVNRTR